MNHQEYQRLLSHESDERSKEEKPSPHLLNMQRKQRAKLGLELPSASFCHQFTAHIVPIAYGGVGVWGVFLLTSLHSYERMMIGR